MSCIYLQEVTISNFRPFGRDFSISMPGPGVTILTGPNGLGKTSFFDAIEWALAGKILRLEESTDDILRQNERRYFLRRLPDGTLSQNCSVRLRFSDGAPIERTCRLLKPQREQTKDAYEDRGTAIESVRNLLLAPDWTLTLKPEQLSIYLRQTHWLAQNAVHRFASQNSEKRWDTWSGPAGMDRLSVLQERLGHRLKTNLTKKQQDYADAVKAKKGQLASWNELLAQRAALRERASGGGALSPAEAQARLNSIFEELRNSFPELNSSFSKVGRLEPATINEAMSTALAVIQAGDRMLAEATTKLNGAADILGQWAQQQLEAERLIAAENLHQQELAGARQREAAAVAQTGALQQQRTDVSVQLDAAESGARQRLHLTAALEQETRLQALLDSQALEVKRLTTAGFEATNRGTVLQKRLGTLQRSEEERRTLLSERRLTLEAMDQFKAWQAQAEARDRSLAHQAALQARLSDGFKRLLDLSAALTQQETIHRQAVSQLQALRSQVGAVTQAVSTIAVHLTAHSEKCPVCLTGFNLGELQRRVEAAIRVEQPALAAAERLVQEACEQKDKLQHEAAEVTASQEILQAQVAEHERLSATVVGLWQRLLDSPLMAGTIAEPAAIQNHLTDRLARVEQSIDALAGRLAESGVSAADLHTQVQQAAATERELVGALSEAQQRLFLLEQQRKEIEATLAAHPQVANALRDLGQRVALEQISAQEIAKLRRQDGELLEIHKESVSKQQAATQLRIEQEARLAAVQQARTESARGRESLQRQWRAAGLSSDPDADVLNRQQQRIRMQRPVLDGVKAVHRQIDDGLARWDAAAQLQMTVESIAAGQKAEATETEEDCTLLLQRRVQDAQDELERVAVVRQGTDWLDAQVKLVAEEYARAILQPINVLATKFSRALSVFLDQRIVIDRWMHGSNPHLLLRARSDQPHHPLDLSANHLLSEGQMSTGSLSLLFAMSVAYRWSRWRGLLLDDPLQNNDIIHISAFADVIRNLAKSQQYQIILSTHDSEISDFISRKMQAAKVPCRVCRFVAPSSAGVMIDSD